MTKLSKSFVFYMKNFDIMQDLGGFGDENEDEINALFEGSGFKNASDMVDSVTDKAKETAQNILLSIGKAIEKEHQFKISSRIPTIKENWYIECWMYEKKPEKGNGFIIKVEIYDYEPDTENKAIGLLTCSIYDTREKGTAILENIFKDNLKEDYEDVFWSNEWPIFDTLIMEDEDEEKIVEDFMQGLSEVLNQERLKKLFEKS